MNRAEVEIHESIEPSQLSQLVRLFAGEWWSRSRTVDDVARVVQASDAVAVATHEPTDSVMGFARVLSDGVYFAMTRCSSLERPPR